LRENFLIRIGPNRPSTAVRREKAVSFEIIGKAMTKGTNVIGEMGFFGATLKITRSALESSGALALMLELGSPLVGGENPSPAAPSAECVDLLGKWGGLPEGVSWCQRAGLWHSKLLRGSTKKGGL